MLRQKKQHRQISVDPVDKVLFMSGMSRFCSEGMGMKKWLDIPMSGRKGDISGIGAVSDLVKYLFRKIRVTVREKTV